MRLPIELSELTLIAGSDPAGVLDSGASSEGRQGDRSSLSHGRAHAYRGQ
jgi:hypothetical protein